MGMGPIQAFKAQLMMGVYVCPEGHQHTVRYVGSIPELAQIADMMGLEPPSRPINPNADIEEEPTILTSESGTYITLAPVDRASDLIQSILTQVASDPIEELFRDIFGGDNGPSDT